MINLHFHPSPNPMKVLLMLEETGLEYRLSPVDTFKGEQHDAAFTAINPNAKVPALEDEGKVIFDSNAILLHLADKTGQFAPPAGEERADVLSWLFFVATGVSPFSGQAVHFLHMCPEDLPYAKNRYLKEVERHYCVMNKRLGETEWLAGADYSIADIAAWGWLNAAGFILGETGLSAWPNLERMHAAISARPAAARANAAKEGLTFKSDFDDEAARALFPQNFAK
ncbi:glutathione S-transferase N-terminal domain-containing protein [uncultured Tateyamaria sp.]|uniref:glutathione S-transferase family protein n=1 Tax=uncultured Tateyamaria sp. TaxID=455651 RepID=UPI00260C35A2|nr:glutathione S-transferase N-terminal domain-containing protein [uncultured Tateyamaria sp.]